MHHNYGEPFFKKLLLMIILKISVINLSKLILSHNDLAINKPKTPLIQLPII
jgi:hypothetical protein